MMIYLDNAAATPVDSRVLAAMMPYFSDEFYNPSAAYLSARKVRADVEEARHTLAKLIGAKSAEIIVTAGATESINLALGGVDGRIVTVAVEHASVLETARQRDGRILAVDSKGRISLDELGGSLTDDVTLVSVGYVNSETGVAQNMRAIAEIVQTDGVVARRCLFSLFFECGDRFD